jgi:hypothetical protein
MDVELPDGTVIEGVPDGTTKSQLIAKLRSSGYDVSKLTPAQDATKFRFASPETEQAGVGALGRLGQATEEFFTKPVAPAPAAVQAQGYDPLAEYAGRVAGNLPRDVTQSAAGFTPEALSATGAALRDRPLQTLSQAGGAALRGAGQFVQHPFETFAENPFSTVTGLQGASLLRTPTQMAANALAQAAYPRVRAAVSPTNRMIYDVFGAPQISEALTQAAPGMTVPQALADINAPRAQAVARQARELLPEETRAATMAQEEARAAQLGGVAGTPGDIAAAKSARDAEAALNYNRAFKQVMTETPELTSIMDRPSMETAFSRAAQIAEERAQPFQIGRTKPAEVTESKILDEFGRPVQKFTPAEIAKYPMQSLHYVKMALDDMVRSPKDFGIGAAEVSAIRDTRKQFISQLENNSNYATARATYAAQSVPINKMQVAQELVKSVTDPLTEGLTRGGMFARAIEEAPKTIKRSTGQEFFKELNEIFSPEEMKVVNGVRDEYRRTKLADEQARLGAKAAPEVEELASAKISSALNIPFLDRTWTIANTLIRRSLGKIDENLAVKIGMMMQDPAELNKAITKAKDYYARTEKGVAAIKEGQRKTVQAIPRKAISGAVSFQNVMAPQQNQNAMAR